MFYYLKCHGIDHTNHTHANLIILRVWNVYLTNCSSYSRIYKLRFFMYWIYEPRQANLCLRAFRHDKFQLRMPSHSEGPGIWFSVWRFLLIHCLYERAAKVLARLRGCAGSPEPSLLAYAISTKFAWRGPYNLSSIFMRNFMTIASLCSWADWFEPYLVENPKDRFLMLRLIWHQSWWLTWRWINSRNWKEHHVMSEILGWKTLCNGRWEYCRKKTFGIVRPCCEANCHLF